MQRLLLLFTVFTSYFIPGNSQVVSHGFVCQDLIIQDVYSDQAGAMYVVGIGLESTGALTKFRAIKYTSDGLVIWSREFSSPSYLKLFSCFNIDGLYLGGSFSNSFCYNNICYPSAGGKDLCQLTISPSGVVFIKTQGGPGDETITGIAADNNSLYSVGHAQGDVVVGDSSFSALLSHGFLLKNNSMLSRNFIELAVPSTSDQVEFQGLVLDNGHLFTMGFSPFNYRSQGVCTSWCNPYYQFDLNGNIQRRIDVGNNQFSTNRLAFQDPGDNLIFLQHIPGKTTYTAFRSYNLWNSDNWQSEVYDDMMGLPIERDNKYYFFEGENFKGGDIPTGVIQKVVNIKAGNTIISGTVRNYLNNDFILFGCFRSSINLGASHFAADTTYKNWYPSFVTILDHNKLTSLYESSGSAPMLKISPNPSSGLYKISATSGSNFRNITVKDFQGKLILQKEVDAELTSFELDISKFDQGLYFISIFSSSGIHTEKVIIN